MLMCKLSALIEELTKLYQKNGEMSVTINGFSGSNSQFEKKIVKTEEDKYPTLILWED